MIRGEAPKDNRERLQLAYRAYEKSLFLASARLFASALEADPKLAEDRQAQHRYNASCAAALAAASKSDGAVPRGEEHQLTDSDRAKFRAKARTWLEAELVTWTELLESTKGEQRKAVAKALGGEIAASRPICDEGWLPMERQIGSSGQTVAPKLYLALGISGAIQHVVGMKGARTIVAVNKDQNAPIFEIADYGIVADIFEVMPALTEALEKAKS